MKHLPLTLAGALLLAGSMTVYAQNQEQLKEPEQSQGSRQQPQSKEGQGERQMKGESKEGQGERQMKGERAQGGEERKPEGKAAQDNQRTERKDEDTGKQGRERAGGDTGSSAKEGQKAQQGGDGVNTQGEKRHAGKKLEAKQRTVVKETIVKRNVRPVKVNFSIRVGAVIPRSVTLYDLPPVLIEYEPSYARYKFILADDDTILVVDPETWTIVDVIEV